MEIKTKSFFERNVEEFDGIYSGKRNLFINWVNRKFRWDVLRRSEIAFEKLSAADIKSVLDIGCGTGRLSLQLAECGKDVVGIDFSCQMIETAKQRSLIKGGHKPSFVFTDFLEYEPARVFDATVALGFFDYTFDAQKFFRKVSRLTARVFIATFPIKGTPRSLFRKIRFFLLNRPVFFYSPKEIEEGLKEAGFSIKDLKKVGNLYFVEAHKI